MGTIRRGGPTRAGEHRRYGIPQTQVCIGGHQLDTSKTPGRLGAQKRKPERAVLAGAHVHPHDLALALCVYSPPRRATETLTILPSSLTF